MNETIFNSPKAIFDYQAKVADMMLEAADETAKRAEQACRETATTFANAIHAQAERAIDGLSVPAKARARSVAIAREAMGAANAPAGK